MNISYDYKVLPKVLIVDDDPNTIELLGSFLGDDFNKQVATSGRKALEILKNSIVLPDLILLDLIMPEIDGYQVCRLIKEDKRLKDIPIIFISALLDSYSIEKAFNLGGIDYIEKPFNVKELRARVANHIDSYHKKIELEKSNMILNKLVEKKVKEISDAQMATIFALAKLTESRDDDTGKHIERVQSFSRLILEKFNILDKYSHIISMDYIEAVEKASALHDIGKIGIQDAILLKPGKLTEEEHNAIKKHTLIGRDTLKEVYNQYPRNKFIKIGIEIAHFHHERWDGGGYPEGLAGYDIPLSARVVALADLYDALRSKRVYKEGYSHKKSCQIILESSGSHIDPEIVKVFIDHEVEFEKKYNSFKNENL